MSGVIVPASRKESAIDTIIKGLSIANSIYGIKADMATAESLKAKEDEAAQAKKDLAAGYISPDQEVDLTKNFQQVEPGTKGAIERKIKSPDGTERVVAFIKPPERGPVVDTAAKDKLAFEREKFAYEKQKDANPSLNPPKPDQLKAATFAQRADQAESIFGKLEEEGYNRASRTEGLKSMLPSAIAPNAGSLKRQEQAERNFVNAVLRRESGSAISDSEFANAETQYFPRAGDTPEVLEQKRQNRLTTIKGLQDEAGSALAVAQNNAAGLRAPKGSTGGWGISDSATAAPAQPSREDVLREIERRKQLRQGGK